MLLFIFVLLSLIALGYIAFYLYKWSGGGSNAQFTNPEIRSKSTVTLDFKENKKAEPYCVVLDVETTGLIKDKKLRPSQKSIQEKNDNFPYVVEISWAILSRNKELIKDGHYLINPGIDIPQAAINVHGITNDKAKSEGIGIKEVLEEFSKDVQQCKAIVGHNIMFDKYVLEAECIRNGLKKPFINKNVYCTMKMGKTVMSQGKPPKLDELCIHLFGNGIRPHLKSHSSLYDSFFTAHCFFLMKNQTNRYWN